LDIYAARLIPSGRAVRALAGLDHRTYQRLHALAGYSIATPRKMSQMADGARSLRLSVARSKDPGTLQPVLCGIWVRLPAPAYRPTMLGATPKR